MSLLTKLNIIPGPPSEAMANFTVDIRQGNNPEIPTYGKPVVVDYYGIRNGAEQARVRIPFGEKEKSYHIRREKGQFTVTNEGFYESKI